MILGLPLSDFVVVHVVLSLLGLVTGGVVLLGLLSGLVPARITALFLLATLLGNVTGLMFPFRALGPGHIVGALSLVVFVPTLAALYRFRLEGGWSAVFVGGVTALLWLNALIAVRQAFAKLVPLQPFAGTAVPHVAQLSLLGVLVLLGTIAAEAMARDTIWSRDKRYR